ncbi:hypothetical protein PIB30_010712 [Stylosanthes scabra]|uniref:MADS-box domain-containing protein n=1 Tax=Stylosanthes scabra TaxID=79078 RepID=A0ABU6X4E3_9FABA|nr:hypothetical protein [Stylosanthes scabra]
MASSSSSSKMKGISTTTTPTRRRKIEIKKVEQSNKRHVTFSKRKLGLFNTVTELSILCNAETVLIVSSQNGKLYVCGYPSPDAVIRRFLNGGDSDSAPKVGLKKKQNERLEALRAQYESAQETLSEEKKLLEEAEMARKNCNHGGDSGSGGLGFSNQWWENPIEEMDLEELVKFKESLEQLKMNLVATAERRIMFKEMMPPLMPSLATTPRQTRFSNFSSILNNNGGFISSVQPQQQQACWNNNWSNNMIINNGIIATSSSSNNLNSLGAWDFGNNAIIAAANGNGNSDGSFLPNNGFGRYY